MQDNHLHLALHLVHILHHPPPLDPCTRHLQVQSLMVPEGIHGNLPAGRSGANYSKQAGQWHWCKH